MKWNFKFKMPFSTKRRNHLDLSHNHTLTHNFGAHTILSCIELSPGDEVNVNLNGFTRLAPMPCPSFGGIKCIHRAYVVNNEFILKHFSDFIALQKAPLSDGANLSHLKIPYFRPRDVYDYIKVASFGFATTVTTGVCDFKITDTKYRLTAKGRRLITWLSQLGYTFPNATSNQGVLQRYDVTALFAFWKYYLDWVVPARFVLNEPRFVYIRNILENLNAQDFEYKLVYRSAGTYADDEIDISQFLMVPTSFLEDDYYTSAFVTPYGVESDAALPPAMSGLAEEFPSSGGSDYYPEFKEDIPFAQGNTDLNLTQFSMLSLGRLQDLVNAKKITSTRVLDYLRVEFGVTPSSDSLRLSQYLGSHDSNVVIGDVMATATTQLENSDPTYVGQYAGKGLGGSSANWKFTSNFHGYMFITCELQVKTSYVNGLNPLRQRFSPLDFFCEKFDNVGVRAIALKELIFNTFEDVSNVTPANIPDPSSVFGFTPRYSEYKHKNDMISGDFLFPSVNTGLDSWYLSRKFGITEHPVIGLEFCSATSDSVGSQYDRIFQNRNNDDHFVSIYHVGIDMATNKESLFDYFKEIDSENSKSDRVTEVAING